MARTDTLGNFLTDVAGAIRTKKGSEEPIAAADFDTEIENLPSGGDLSEYFEETVASGTGADKPGFYNALKKLPALTNTGTNCQYMFYNCPFPEIDLSKIDTSDVTDMNNMFAYTKCVSLDLSNFDFSKTRDLSMFLNGSSYIRRLTLPLEQQQTTSLTTTQGMFSGVGQGIRSGEKLETLNVNFLNTTNVTNMKSMFTAISTLKTLVLDNLRTNNVTTMENMFRGLQNITSLDLRNFDMSKTTETGYMFSGCYDLTILNLTGVPISSDLSRSNYMFEGCSSLTELDLSSFNTRLSYAPNMFNGCTSLQKLDVRGMTFPSLSSSSYYSNIFTGVPVNCEIIVKDDTQKNWVLTVRNDFTNVKTVAEYEAEQNA